jgi:transposase-like protein
MSEAKKKKVHTPEFKAKVSLDALRGQKTIEVAPKIRTVC